VTIVPSVGTLPEVPGILTADEVALTAKSLIDLQLPNGMIPWFPGGHCDPWNHVEAAMALSVCGHFAEAEAAYQWLADVQLGDGSWFNYYLADSIEDSRLDTNVCAYIAAGLWHHSLIVGDDEILERHFEMMERAIDFVLRWQLPEGSIRWSLDAAGRIETYALLTGSSSIYHSLRCAIAVAEKLGRHRPDWELAAGRLGHAVAHHPGAFAPKNEFAMDWYYPMLSGALEGDLARRRIEEYWDEFVMFGLGVRCVSTSDWVTAAETAECVMTLDALGMRDQALELFEVAQGHRRPDGSYFTGLAYPDVVTYPDQETTSYTAAAIILAADALTSTSPAAGLFRGETLEKTLDLAGPRCDSRNGGICQISR
jgi:hypothetical protein